MSSEVILTPRNKYRFPEEGKFMYDRREPMTQTTELQLSDDACHI